MLRYVYARNLTDFPRLRDSMFIDRAKQFKNRLNWDVHLTDQGHEIDEYDALNPLYVIWQNRNGLHGGSMRLMPTEGPNMIRDHFPDLLGTTPVFAPDVWECTRFCLSPQAEPRVAAALMLAGGEVMRHLRVSTFVGIFDRRMERIYRLIGASPEILNNSGAGNERISLGLWHFSAASHARVSRRAMVSQELSELWFQRSLDHDNH